MTSATPGEKKSMLNGKWLLYACAKKKSTATLSLSVMWYHMQHYTLVSTFHKPK